MSVNSLISVVILALVYDVNCRVTSSKQYKVDCDSSLDDKFKKDCGYPGVTQRKCLDFGCCFKMSNMPGVPWCFSDSRKSESRNLPVQPKQKQSEPEWMKKLLDLLKFIEDNNPFTVGPSSAPTTTSTTPEITTTTTTQRTTTLNIIDMEIQDEIMCQNTYKIFQEVDGNSKCSAVGQQRVKCDIIKQPGESDCSACLKMGCCYDAILKKASTFDFIHRCYKSDLQTTAAPTISTTSNWLNLFSKFTTEPQKSPGQNTLEPTKPPSKSIDRENSNNNKIDIEKILSGLIGNKGKKDSQKEIHQVPEHEKIEFKKQPSKLCYPKQCGYRVTDKEVRASARIVGGQWSGGIQYWPWMTSLKRNFTDDWRYRHVCGATLISNRWILTAGHCFTKYLQRSVKVAGERETDINIFAITVGNYFRDDAQRSMQVRMLAEYHAHPLYDYSSLSNDVAVAKLREPVQFTDYVQPACLPNKVDTLEVGTQTWVTGWGETYNIGHHTKSKLKELPLPLVSSEVCRSYWREFYHKSWICTEGAYLEDACAGDSGGPLVHRDTDRRWDIVGVAIAGTKRCSTDRDDIRPGIYANVAYYREFIDAYTNGSC